MSTDLIELFPECYRGDCPEGPPGAHKHIFPHQQELLESAERYVAIVGGYGAGKSLPMAVMAHVLSTMIPGNVGVICRRSFPKLRDSIQRDFMLILERAGIDCTFMERRDRWANRVVYPNASEVWFRETSDMGRWLGPSLGWFILDEAIEEPYKTFTDLVGRLRLPAAGKYLRGIIGSNPPDITHWIAKVFGTEPGVRTVVRDTSRGRKVKVTFRLIQVATSANRALPDSYEGDQLAVLDPNEARRVLEGQFGFAFEGKGVYAGAFDYAKHVGLWPLQRLGPRGAILPMTRGWDFGFHHPAVLWSQIYRCPQGIMHCVFHQEFCPEDTEAEDVAREVLSQSRLAYTAASFTDVGDPAGAQAGAGKSSMDSPIYRLAAPPLNLRIRYLKIPDISPGIALARVLFKRKRCACGVPVLGVTPACGLLIKALAGGYHYAKPRYGRATPNKPIKDGLYDDPADAFRYILELEYKMKAVDPTLWADLRRELGAGDMAPLRTPGPEDVAQHWQTEHLTNTR